MMTTATSPDNAPSSPTASSRTWNYRVMSFRHGEEAWQAIHEVHYRDGVPFAYTEAAAVAMWDPDDVDGGLRSLERMREALSKPVLTDADFKTGRDCSTSASVDEAPSAKRVDTVEAARAALRILFNIADAWGLTHREQEQLLDVDQATCSHWRDGKVHESLPAPTLQRLGYVLTIYAALQTLLPVPERADAWVLQPNAAPLFGGQPAITMMVGPVGGLQAVADYLASVPTGS